MSQHRILEERVLQDGIVLLTLFAVCCPIPKRRQGTSHLTEYKDFFLSALSSIMARG